MQRHIILFLPDPNNCKISEKITNKAVLKVIVIVLVPSCTTICHLGLTYCFSYVECPIV